MQISSKIVAVLSALLIVGGCQKADSSAGRMRYPGAAQFSNVRPGSLPEAKAPKILPQTHFAAGMMFEVQGNIGKAIIQYRKAVALNHNYMAAYHRLGRMYGLAGKHEEAIKAVTRATEIKPDNAILQNDLSFEYMFVGRWDDAERALRRAIVLRPKMARAHINLALVQSKQGRFDDALATFRQVLPETDAYYNLGLLYRGNREYEKAADSFRHVLAISEDFVAARTQLDELRADLKINNPEKLEMVGPIFVETPQSETPHPKTQKLPNRKAQKTRTAATAQTPTPTAAQEPGSWEQGRDLLAEVARSILSESADVIRGSETSTQETKRLGNTWPMIEKVNGQRESERDELIASINAAIDAHVVSPQLDGSAVSDDATPTQWVKLAGSTRPTIEKINVQRDGERDELIASINAAIDAHVVSPQPGVNTVSDDGAPTQETRRSGSTWRMIDKADGQRESERDELIASINAAMDAHVVSSNLGLTAVPDDAAVTIDSADASRRGEARTQWVKLAGNTRPTIEKIIGQRYGKRDELIASINAAIDAHVASSKLGVTAVFDDRALTIGFEAECDEGVTPAPVLAQSTSVFDEIERLSYNTDEEFVETQAGAVAEASDRRVEWGQERVTLDELIEIMDNERRCFGETEFADIVPDWPIVDSLAYSPAEFDAPAPDPWADFRRLQAELDARAQAVTAMVHKVGWHDTETKLAALEKSVASMTRQVAQRKAAAKGNADAKRRFQAKATRKGGDRFASALSARTPDASRTMVSQPDANVRKKARATTSPTVLAGPHGSPRDLAADRGGAEDEHRRGGSAHRMTQAGKTRIVHRGVKVDWRDGFRKINAIAAIVTNDIVCFRGETMKDQHAVVSVVDGENVAVSDAPRERSRTTRVIGAPTSTKSKGTRRK